MSNNLSFLKFQKNIIHRDLKMANTVFNRRTRKVILTNFSLGRHLANENELINDRVGTPHYISPDILSDKPYKGKPADAWSLGVIFYFLLYNKLPFSESTRALLYKKIKVNEYVIPTDQEISPETIHLVKSIFKANPDERLTVPEIRSHVEKIIVGKLRQRLKADDHLVPDLSKPIKPKEDPSLRQNYIPDRKEYGYAVNQQMRNLSITTVPLRSESSYFNRPSALHPCHFTARIRPSVFQPSLNVETEQPPTPAQIKESIVKTFVAVLQNQRDHNPLKINFENLISFDGIVTADVARKFCNVLNRDFNSNSIIQSILSENDLSNINTDSNTVPICADVKRIEKFFGYLNINTTDITNESFKIQRDQPRGRQPFLDYILICAGFNTLYFASSVFHARFVQCVPLRNININNNNNENNLNITNNS